MPAAPDFLPVKRRNGTIIAWTHIDPDMYDFLSLVTWRLSTQGYVYYSEGGRYFFMHHFVLDVKPEGNRRTDHRNRNKLDNRRCNLRITTAAVNAANTPVQSRSRSGVKNVYATKYGTFEAYITTKGKRISFGTFPTVEEAALVAKEAHDEIYACM